MAEKDSKDSFDHVVKTTEQWESRSYEYWIIPRGVLCVELTPDKKTKIKIGEGNKIYSQLPYINSETDLSDYYTKEEIDNILAMLNFVAIPSSEIYPTKEALPQTGNRQGDLRFVLNVGGDPYSYLWFNNKWIQVGGVDLSEYAKKSEVNPRLNALELKAHTHANKSVLDRLTANVIDDSHRHVNKNILDATTAPYTTQDKATLDALAAITVFEGATKTEDGTMGYVPAPLQGQQSYYLKGDGTWAYLAPGDKYKAGEGIYILSGEATSDTFPFNIYSRGNQVKQYIIYGNIGGVGELVNGEYHIPVVVSALGHPNRTSVIILSEPMYDGDYIDFEKQIFAHYRTDITSQVQHADTDTQQTGISSAGNLYWKSSYRGWGGSPRVTDYFELESDARYEISKVHPDGDFSDSLNINLYDENKNRTRTIVTSTSTSTGFSPNENEKYMRQSYTGVDSGYCHVFKLKATETPCVLQEVLLYPNAINSIDIDTTVKPAEAYFEVLEPEEPDPEDPLSEYTGIIYNDGVLDVTQENPNALNELTVHFRENVEKTLTIPTYELPIATDSTLGGIIVGANLTIDENGVLNGKSGDKYKAGEGVTILSGEVIADTFPFEIFPKAATVTQYVIYGTASGVGNLVSGRYEIPIKVSAPGYSDRIQTITVNDPLYDGDYINFQKQVFAHYRTKISNLVEQDPNYSYEYAVYSDGSIAHFSPGAYGGAPVVSKPFELTPGASYELHPWDYSGQQYSRFHDGMYINIYDADMNRTRTLYQEHLGNTVIVVADGEKYMRMTMQERNKPLGYYGYQDLYMLYPVESPCQLQQLTLYPDVINTVDVLTTNKPNEIYVEVVPPEDIEPDPEDPLSEYTGIIYNDGVLDVTQEDPNNLNELTFHFRDDVDKTLTIPTAALPIASDTTLGGIKVGANLTIDPETGVLDAIGGGTEYAAGDGIQIDPGTSVIDITNIQWQQGKIDDSDGSEAISDVEPYLDCEMFEITSHTNMVTLSGTYDNNIMLLWKPYYYDENENYISTVNTWSTYEDGVQIPINAKYVRFVLTEDETTTLDPNDLAHVEIEYPLEVGKEVITNAGVIDVQVRDRKLIIIKHDHVEEIPIPDPPLATTTTPGIVVVGEDLDIDEDGVLNIADINRLILNAEE